MTVKRALDNLGQVKNRIPWGRTGGHPSQPLSFASEEYTSSFPKIGPFTIIHFYVLLSPNAYPSPSQKGGGTAGSAL